MDIINPNERLVRIRVQVTKISETVIDFALNKLALPNTREPNYSPFKFESTPEDDQVDDDKI